MMTNEEFSREHEGLIGRIQRAIKDWYESVDEPVPPPGVESSSRKKMLMAKAMLRQTIQNKDHESLLIIEKFLIDPDVITPTMIVVTTAALRAAQCIPTFPVMTIDHIHRNNRFDAVMDEERPSGKLSLAVNGQWRAHLLRALSITASEGTSLFLNSNLARVHDAMVVLGITTVADLAIMVDDLRMGSMALSDGLL